MVDGVPVSTYRSSAALFVEDETPTWIDVELLIARAGWYTVKGVVETESGFVILTALGTYRFPYVSTSSWTVANNPNENRLSISDEALS